MKWDFALMLHSINFKCRQLERHSQTDIHIHTYMFCDNNSIPIEHNKVLSTCTTLIDLKLKLLLLWGWKCWRFQILWKISQGSFQLSSSSRLINIIFKMEISSWESRKINWKLNYNLESLLFHSNEFFNEKFSLNDFAVLCIKEVLKVKSTGERRWWKFLTFNLRILKIYFYFRTYLGPLNVSLTT